MCDIYINSSSNLLDFVNYYHNLQNSYIKSVSYDTFKSIVTIIIDVYWAGDKVYRSTDSNRIKLKIQFENIKEFNCKTIESFDYINKVYFKYIKINGEEYLCFSNELEKPLFYVVCKKMCYCQIQEG